MNEWDATKYGAKDNLLRVVKQQAEALFGLAAAPGAWEAPTASEKWQVRDIVGHIIDVTESYFVGFDAARGGTALPDALGVRVMQERLDEGAKIHRQLGQEEAVSRLQTDFHKITEIFHALGPDDWTGLTVAHKYMGPLPAFYFPVFQLMDYGIHTWDIRQGTGRAHGLPGDVADLLVPFMFGIWQGTAEMPADAPACEIGIQIATGHNAGNWRINAGPEGFTYTKGEVEGLPAVLDFDAGNFVLTAFGRSNAGSVRGDAAVADRYLNLFFRL
jgi:uncharacterized protein (TIGR03083 family)